MLYLANDQSDSVQEAVSNFSACDTQHSQPKFSFHYRPSEYCANIVKFCTETERKKKRNMDHTKEKVSRILHYLLSGELNKVKDPVKKQIKDQLDYLDFTCNKIIELFNQASKADEDKDSSLSQSK